MRLNQSTEPVGKIAGEEIEEIEGKAEHTYSIHASRHTTLNKKVEKKVTLKRIRLRSVISVGFGLRWLLKSS